MEQGIELSEVPGNPRPQKLPRTCPTWPDRIPTRSRQEGS